MVIRFNLDILDSLDIFVFNLDILCGSVMITKSPDSYNLNYAAEVWQCWGVVGARGAELTITSGDKDSDDSNEMIEHEFLKPDVVTFTRRVSSAAASRRSGLRWYLYEQ